MAFEIWDEFNEGVLQFAWSAFAETEPWAKILFFIGIIGFIYTSLSSITLAIVGILLTFALFGGVEGSNIFETVPEVSKFFYIVCVIGLTCLIVTVLLKRRNN